MVKYEKHITREVRGHDGHIAYCEEYAFKSKDIKTWDMASVNIYPPGGEIIAQTRYFQRDHRADEPLMRDFNSWFTSPSLYALDAIFEKAKAGETHLSAPENCVALLTSRKQGELVLHIGLGKATGLQLYLPQESISEEDRADAEDYYDATKACAVRSARHFYNIVAKPEDLYHSNNIYEPDSGRFIHVCSTGLLGNELSRTTSLPLDDLETAVETETLTRSSLLIIRKTLNTSIATKAA